MGYQVLKFSGCGVGMIYNFLHPHASRSRSVRGGAPLRIAPRFGLGGDYAEHGVIINSIG